MTEPKLAIFLVSVTAVIMTHGFGLVSYGRNYVKVFGVYGNCPC